MRRAREARPLRCLPAATARCDGREAVRSVSVADRAGGAFPADVCAHTVAHRSWCLTPGRSDLPTKIRTPVTGAFRSSGADASMLPRIPSSEGPTDDRLARLSHDRRWYIAKRVVARHLKARKPDPRCTCPRTVPHAGGEIRPQRRWGRRSKTASYAHGALGPVLERVTRRSWTRAARKQEKPTQGHLFGPWSQVGQFNVNTPTRSSSVSRRPTRIDKGSTGERTVQKWWPRGDSKPEKPTQGAPARAACTGKARLARRFAHESERRFGVYWAHRGTKGR